MSSSPVEFSIAPPAPDAFRDRRPPYSEEAETAVIAAMLMDQDAILRAIEHVDDTMFYREGHRRIFRAMASIAERGDVVDPLTLMEELSRHGELEGAGGKDYIGFLLDAVPTSANVEYHARIVKEKALQRRLIETCTALIGEAYAGTSTAAELLDEAEHRVFQVSQQRGTQGFMRVKELMWPTMERIEALQRGGKTITGVAHRLHRSRRAHVRLPELRSRDRRGAPVHGQDGVRAERRAIRCDREEYSGGGLFPGNE